MSFFTNNTGEPRWGRVGITATLFFLAAPGACATYSAFSSAATAPGRVATRVLETDSILQNYEMFFDLNAQFIAREGQIADQEAYLGEEADPQEKRRLRMELAAMKQSCRDIAVKYNANSQKQSRALFKANNLPETLKCKS